MGGLALGIAVGVVGTVVVAAVLVPAAGVLFVMAALTRDR